MVLEAIAQATTVVKIVLFILFLSSFVAWTLIFYNILWFRKIERKNEEFLDFFWAEGLEVPLSKFDRFKPSPLAKIGAEVVSAFKYGKGDKQSLTRILSAETRSAVDEISKFQFIFATIASTAPFVGLFGTVWGIMHAFHEIGRMGRAGLDVVAPAISEALFTTAMGLFAAIPAAVAYNYFQNKIRKIAGQIEYFSAEFQVFVEEKLARKGEG